jgi:hypothetical protein
LQVTEEHFASSEDEHRSGAATRRKDSQRETKIASIAAENDGLRELVMANVPPRGFEPLFPD